MNTHTRTSRKYIAATSAVALLLGSLTLTGCGNGDDDMPPMDQPVDEDVPPMDQSTDNGSMDEDMPAMDQSTDNGPVDEGTGEETVEEDPMMQQDEGV